MSLKNMEDACMQAPVARPRLPGSMPVVAGKRPDLWSRLAGQQAKLKAIAEFAHRVLLSSPDQDRARRILGANFHGPDEVERLFGVRYSDVEIAALTKVPYEDWMLRRLPSECILFPGFPLSLLDMRERTSGRLRFPRCWEHESFASDPCIALGWHLLYPIKKTHFGSNVSLRDQERYLRRNEYVPPARLISLGIALHGRASGERLLNDILLYAGDRFLDGQHVVVSECEPGILCYCRAETVLRRNRLGFAVTVLP